MSSYTLLGKSAPFGFGLNRRFIWLFEIIGEFLSRLDHPGCSRNTNAIRKHPYQNLGEKAPDLLLSSLGGGRGVEHTSA